MGRRMLPNCCTSSSSSSSSSSSTLLLLLLPPYSAAQAYGHCSISILTAYNFALSPDRPN